MLVSGSNRGQSYNIHNLWLPFWSTKNAQRSKIFVFLNSLFGSPHPLPTVAGRVNKIWLPCSLLGNKNPHQKKVRSSIYWSSSGLWATRPLWFTCPPPHGCHPHQPSKDQSQPPRDVPPPTEHATPPPTDAAVHGGGGAAKYLGLWGQISSSSFSPSWRKRHGWPEKHEILRCVPRCISSSKYRWRNVGTKNISSSLAECKINKTFTASSFVLMFDVRWTGSLQTAASCCRCYGNIKLKLIKFPSIPACFNRKIPLCAAPFKSNEHDVCDSPFAVVIFTSI